MTGWLESLTSLTVGSGLWLLLALALPLVYLLSRNSLTGLSRGRRLTAVVLRTLAFVLIILAIAGAHLRLRDERLCVMFVADLSDSIPTEKRQAIREYILEKQAECDFAGGDQIGVVVFGKDAGIEVSPRSEPFEVEDFVTLVDPKATSIEAAIRLAVAAFPDDVGGKRLVILSDGNENTGRALEEIRATRSLGVTVDVIAVPYKFDRELRVEKLIVEPQLQVGEPFNVQVIVTSTVETDVRFHFFQNNAVVPQPDPVRRVTRGKNSFFFRDLRRDSPGATTFEVVVEPLSSDDDVVLDNNKASGFAMIQGEPKILLCATEPELEGQLEDALRTEKIGVDLVAPEFLPRDIQDYLEYDAVILSNVAAHQLTTERMNLFEGLVKGLGVGFVMIGGENSFGPGAYQGTAVERLLPVDMEIKQRKNLPNGALAIVAHSCELSNGNEWGRRVIQQAIKILSPRDWVGVLYHDNRGGEQWLFPMTQCTRKQFMINKLRGFNPGDMMSFHRIMQLALGGLKNTHASLKHMIVLSDGDPAPPSQALVNEIVNDNGVTISTICYGAHGTPPATMKALADQGRGKYYYLTSARDLPEFFIREASRVRKSLISEKSFTPQVAGRTPILQGVADEGMPPLDGYVLTAPKPLANVALVRPATAEDPSQDPVLAAWGYGLGKSVAFTSDAGRRWGKHWASWSQYERFWVQLVRWVQRSRRADRFRATRQLDGDKAKVIIEAFDEVGGYIHNLDLKGRVVSPGPKHETTEVSARQVGLGRYQVEFAVKGPGTHMVSLQSVIDGATVQFATGLTVPYSPEYRELSNDHELLRQLAEAGGGRYFGPDFQGEVNLFSRDFTVSYSVQEIWRTLVILALVLFFVDVFIRRVLIDYRAAYARVAGFASAVARRREMRQRESDARLATLLRKKAEVRGKTQARGPGGAPPKEPAPSEKEQTPVLDTAFDAGASVAQRPRTETATKPKKEAPSVSPEEEGAAYTSRLLKAKRRALKRDDKKD